MRGLVHPVYRIIAPATDGDFVSQWTSCVNRLLEVQQNEGLLPFRLNVFAKETSREELSLNTEHIKAVLNEAYGLNCPPWSITVHPPENQQTFIIEAGFVHSVEAAVSYYTFLQFRYCIIDNGEYREICCVGIGNGACGDDIITSSRKSFAALQSILTHAAMGLNNIVRQWNYVPEITCIKQINSLMVQNYQAFNEVRNEFYGHYRSEPSFPAATGIGLIGNGLIIDFMGISGDADLHTISIRNPQQTNSYNYKQDVLMGQPITRVNGKQPPQFERAKLLTLHNSVRLLISGTASIIGQKTVGMGDVAHQTHVTLQNIELLSNAENIRNQCAITCEIPNQYSYARVYVKYASDFPLVKSICAPYFENTPVSYIQSDICREDLLVEIEAEKIS